MGDSLLQKFAGGKALRMRRLCRADGRLLLVAMDHAAFMGPADGLDLPTLCAVVRAGTSPEGLPIGVQLVARNWCDEVALSAAKAIEKSLGGWRPASVIP